MKIIENGSFHAGGGIMVKLEDGFWYYLEDTEWNGEKFFNVWRYKDRRGFERADNKEFTLAPEYDWDDEECPIIGYEVY